GEPPPPRCANSSPRALSSPCPSPHRRPATSTAWAWMRSSAPSRPNRFMPSVSGTKTSRRPPTKRCANCSRAPNTRSPLRPDNKQRAGCEQIEGATMDMSTANLNIMTDTVRETARALAGETSDYDPLLKLVGAARFCLLGEATHGTDEFYRERAEITKRLIAEKGFAAVAVEADWPDAFRVNRYVRGMSDDKNADAALSGFKRFPTWMWRNHVVLDFIEWLRAYNDALPTNAQRVGFYGLDLYSLYTSIEAVLGYLDKIDPQAAKRARYRYACFEHFGENTQAYGYATSFGMTEPCEREVVSQLVELRRRAAAYAARDGRVARDEFFFAEQNARLVKNAEEYYRAMFRGRVESWNLRDRHMAETLDALVAHVDAQGQAAHVAVWEHNSHLGDARATYMADYGELNVGQLMR